MKGDDSGNATPERKQQVRALVELWRPVLFLEGWTINISHERRAKVSSPTCSADIHLGAGYRTIGICVFPKFWEKGVTDTERSFTVLHELSHVITASQRSLAFDALGEKLVRGQEIREANEFATDWIAQIVARLSEQLADAQGAAQ